MLPAHLAENIRRQIQFYMQSTFDFQDKSGRGGDFVGRVTSSGSGDFVGVSDGLKFGQ